MSVFTTVKGSHGNASYELHWLGLCESALPRGEKRTRGCGLEGMRRQRRLRLRVRGRLPRTASSCPFGPVAHAVGLLGMGNNKKQSKRMSDGSRGNESALNKLPRMEMYAVLGLELGQRIFEKLLEFDTCLEVFARQKARELSASGKRKPKR